MTEDPFQRLFASLTDLDTAHPIDEITTETLEILSDRMERSTLPRHFLLREAELDDLWRAAEATIRKARRSGQSTATIRALEQLLSVAMQAHDLAGEGRVAEATATLRQQALGLLPTGEK